MKKLLTFITIFTLTFTFIFAINPKTKLNADIIDDLYTVENAEFRAAWVSYYTGDIRFNNIEDYKTRIDEILDILEFYNMNAMIFHVRANHEAWYKSELNRTQSQLAGLNFDEFDPLEYVVTEAHKRGIEFHAWLNPYRIGSTFKSAEEVAQAFKGYPNNPASKAENVLIGSTLQILDPGLPENREFIIDTCLEIVENYDVDAIHFDDYFYANGIDDSKTRAKYNTDNLSTSDFRRLQVDTFIYDLKCALDEFNSTNNRFVQLGISPTGVYKNASSQSEASTPLSEYRYNENGDLVYPQGATTGCQMHFESYLFCDTLKWVNNEWINYILPQTYWAQNHSRAPYKPLITWWNAAVKNKNVNLYSGMGIYMWTSQTNEAKEQLTIAHNLDKVMGTSIYSFGEIMDGFRGDNTAARSQMALVKHYHWNSKTIPTQVSGFEAQQLGSVDNFAQHGNTISFSALDNAKFYIIYKSENDLTYSSSEIVDIIGGDEEFFIWTDTYTGDYNYNVIPVSHTNTLGKPVEKATEILKGNVSYELFSDNQFENKYNITNALNLEQGKNVYIKINDNVASNVLTDYIWTSDNEEVLTIDDNGIVTINGLGTANIHGILKTDDTKIVHISINVYIGDIINNTYNVKFYDYDGTLLKEEQVQYGQSAVPPTGLTRAEEIQCTYEFVGWNEDYTNITKDVEFHAVYSVNLKLFTVVFKNLDGTILKEEIVPYGLPANEPDQPTMAPSVEYTYEFKGWDQEFGKITSDLVVTAEYYTNENMYQIQFKTNGGTKIGTEFYFYYEMVYAPTNPKKEGYDFLGWYYDEGLTNECTFPTKLVANTVVYAKWGKLVNINFYNENESLHQTLKLNQNELCTNIPTLEKTNFEFIGWSIDKTTLFDFNNPITENINLYPIFREIKQEFIVTYYDNNNNVIKEETALADQIFNNTTTYNVSGYKFVGWSLDKENIYNFDTPITDNLYLYPLLVKLYTVKFYNDNGKIFETMYIEEGTKIIEDIKLSVDGYNFLGWSLDRNNKFDFNTIINEDITLFPLLQEIEKDSSNKNCKCNSTNMILNIMVLSFSLILIIKKKRA